MCADFHSAKSDLMKVLLPPEIFDSLKINAEIQGWANVNPADVLDYILSDEFADLSENDLSTFLKKINQPWDKL